MVRFLWHFFFPGKVGSFAARITPTGGALVEIASTEKAMMFML